MSPLFLKLSQSEESQKKKNYSENAKITCLKLISGAFRNPDIHREHI
jgi:hypothetical protein